MPNNDVVEIWVRSHDIDLIESGLKRLIIGLAELKQRGYSTVATVDLVSGLGPKGRGRYSQPLAERIFALWAKLSSKHQSPPVTRSRLRLDWVELSICALSGRIAPCDRSSSNRLQQHLEKYRRRAVRRDIRLQGRPQHEEKAIEWREFVRYLRVHIVRKPFITTRRAVVRMQRLYISAGMERARKEILSRGQVVPPEPELRRLVRLAIRYSRRGRIGLSVPKLVDTETGAFYLATFILARSNKAVVSNSGGTYEEEEEQESAA